MRKLELHWQIFIAIGLAILYGIFLKDYVEYVGWMGDLFLRALKMVVIPLVLTSIITGVTNLGEGGGLGRLGFKTIVFYVFSTLLATLLGLFLVNLIKPGKGLNINMEGIDDFAVEKQSLKNTLINIVPDNLFQAFTSGDLLAVIFFAILVGVAITKLNNDSSGFLKNFFRSFFDVFMKITMFIIKIAPLGIFGLIAKVVSEQDNFGQVIYNLGLFSLTIISGLIIHSFVTLPLLLKIIGKVNPFQHFRNMSTAMLTAFSTASSAATLPLTIKGVNEYSGVSKKITNFTLPIGATVNMDGTAIYISGIVIFIAQIQGMELGFNEQFIIVLTTLLTSIGTAGIPMASLVILTIILDILGLPVELVALIFPVDRILDMMRTATNIWSDSSAAVIIARTEKEDLPIACDKKKHS